MRARLAANPNNTSSPMTMVGVAKRPMVSVNSFMYFSLEVTSRSSYSIPC